MMPISIPLPPSIQGRVRERHRRDRVRVEMSPSQGRWLLDRLEEAIASVGIDDPEFKDLYKLYDSVSSQMNRAEGTKEA